jgi:hypothetical protein
VLGLGKEGLYACYGENRTHGVAFFLVDIFLFLQIFNIYTLVGIDTSTSTFHGIVGKFLVFSAV